MINDLSLFISSVKNKLGSVKPTSIKKLDIASDSFNVTFSASMVLLVLLWILNPDVFLVASSMLLSSFENQVEGVATISVDELFNV